LGVDACKAGWVGIVLDASQVLAVFAPTIGDLVAGTGPVDGVAIDIPIGLLEGGRRKADGLAKEVVGARRNSIFFTAVRSALMARTHAEATHVSLQLTGAGASQQSWALGPKIFEVEEWLRGYPGPVWEIHPEVSFATLARHPLSHPKRSWAGVRERCSLLESAGIVLGAVSGEATRRATVDDMLDAAVAAWSARRLVAGQGVSYPHPPEKSDTGRDCAIWA
jgi:predicted RNase H-like nuclease